MAPTVIDAEMELNSCPHSDVSCASPNKREPTGSNELIDIGYASEQVDDIKNCVAKVTVIEMEGTEEEEEEEEEEEGGDETEFPHEPGKIFIGGLNPGTTVETLKLYFWKYGDIRNCLIMRDIVTKKSRGFGFVTFVDPNVVKTVLDDAPHTLDSNRIEPKIAVPKQTTLKAITNALSRTKKVFIGGVATATTEDDLRAYFLTYGDIDSCELMFDRTTNRSRGFGFITFATEAAAKNACQKHFHTVNNKTVEVKRAVPREVISNTNTLLRQRQLTAPTLPATNCQNEVVSSVPNTGQYLGAGTSSASTHHSALSLPHMVTMTVNALQQKAQQQQQQVNARLIAPNPMLSPPLQPAMPPFQNFSYLLPLNYQDGSLLAQADTTSMLSCSQSSLATATIAPCEYAAVLGTSYPSANSALAPFPSPLPTVFPNPVGLPAAQQALINGTAQGYDVTGLNMATVLQSPYPPPIPANQAYDAVAAAVAYNFCLLQEQQHQAAVMALQMSAAPIPPVTSTSPPLAAPVQVQNAALINGQTAANSMECQHRTLMQQLPDNKGSTTVSTAISQSIHGSHPHEQVPASLSGAVAVSDASSGLYFMPAKIPRENYATFEVPIW